jgi:thiosulfate/3-mercaptopyruvate sulfurtransferase
MMVDVLIDAAELKGLLAAGPVGAVHRAASVLDARWQLGGPPGRGEFELGHVPGARFVDTDADLAGQPGIAGRHPLPATGAFEAAMRRLGVNNAGTVVVYDGRDSMSAARCWWLLVYHGHGDVRVLDGGFAAWRAAGGSIETGVEVATLSEGDFRADPGHLPVLDADGAGALARRGLLLDVRSGERYRGEIEPIDPIAGHIPGAVSAPVSGSVDSDGKWRSPEDLRGRFASLGAAGGRAVGTYCGSGITAAHEVLSLRLAGFEAALYPGSWSEWIADRSRTVATGPEPS